MIHKWTWKSEYFIQRSSTATLLTTHQVRPLATIHSFVLQCKHSIVRQFVKRLSVRNKFMKQIHCATRLSVIWKILYIGDSFAFYTCSSHSSLLAQLLCYSE